MSNRPGHVAGCARTEIGPKRFMHSPWPTTTRSQSRPLQRPSLAAPRAGSVSFSPVLEGLARAASGAGHTRVAQDPRFCDARAGPMRQFGFHFKCTFDGRVVSGLCHDGTKTWAVHPQMHLRRRTRVAADQTVTHSWSVSDASYPTGHMTRYSSAPAGVGFEECQDKQ